jgi:hypothetical protein
MGFLGMRDLLQRHIPEQRLSAYVDGRLGAHERQRVERHLQTCNACRRDLVELRAVLAMLHRAPKRPVPRSFALPLSVQNQQTAFRRWDRAYGALRVAAVAASLVLVLFLSGDLLMTRGVIPIPDRMPVASAPLARTMQEKTGDAEALPMPPEEPMAAPERLGAEESSDAAPLALSVPRESPDSVATPDAPAAMDRAPQLAREPRERSMVGAPSPTSDDAPPMAETESLALEVVEPQARAAGAPPEAVLPAEVTAEQDLAEKLVPERALAPTVAPDPTPVPLRIAEQEAPVPQESNGAELSIVWRLWYAARVLSGILFGLVLVLVAGLLWIGQKRRI